MNPSQGLVTSLNAIREMSIQNGTAYHQYVPIIDENTDIGSFGAPILNTPVVMNEFLSMLVNRIVYTSFETKYFRNPLQVLEGDRIPLGYAGQEIYVNPAKGRKYNVNDFAGLLVKYEADVKVQYTSVNMDLQYPVTVARHKLKQAFVSWEALDSFVAELSNSLYNGAYIDEYKFTKGLVSSAYKSNQAQVEVLSAPTTEALAKTFTTKLREMYLNMQVPSSEFNAWKKVGGFGREIITYTNPEDIVVLVRNDIRAFLDVNVLAQAFNIDKATLMGNIISVDSFDEYDEEGNKIFDGSNILGFIGDKSWFRIKRQDMYLDEFYNANNRTWQYYLNLTKMYNYSLFANGVILATSEASISATAIEFTNSSETLTMGTPKVLEIVTTPVGATETINFTSSDSGEDYVEIEKVDNRHVKVTPKSATGSAVTITATGATSGVSGTCEVNVNDILVSDMSFKYSTRSITGTGKVTNDLTLNPTNASETINFTSSDTLETYVTITKKSNTKVEVTGVSNTSEPVVITATGESSGKTATFSVTVSGNE